ncbi:hypothetical protein [Limimaricola pyoseonensis]|uniref:hypothetical protein n=1 Tax=Limimaricola pyoseonensis TaxID=521013 RepID=UPI000B7EB525|nr:hypothetical protein [Limimaricola pyoseonensis]
MKLRDEILKNVGVWLAVYPSVLAFSYGFKWLGIEVALWIEILISTALTVPLISYVAVPIVEKLIADYENTTPAEMKREEAEEAPGGRKSKS